MKKITSFNPKNKEEIAKTIEVIFDKKNEVPEYIRKMLLEKLMWATTENDDSGKKKKYFGQRYWSIGAIKQLIENKTKKKKNNYNLVHEHAVPKKIIIKEIKKLNIKNRKSIFGILDKLGHSVILSKEEDVLLNLIGLRSKMPDNHNKNVFARYKHANIQIYDLQDKNITDVLLTDLNKLKRIT